MMRLAPPLMFAASAVGAGFAEDANMQSTGSACVIVAVLSLIWWVSQGDDDAG